MNETIKYLDTTQQMKTNDTYRVDVEIYENKCIMTNGYTSQNIQRKCSKRKFEKR